MYTNESRRYINRSDQRKAWDNTTVPGSRWLPGPGGSRRIGTGHGFERDNARSASILGNETVGQRRRSNASLHFFAAPYSAMNCVRLQPF